MFGIFGVETYSLWLFYSFEHDLNKEKNPDLFLIFLLHIGELTLHYARHQNSNDDKVVFPSQVSRTKI